MRFFVLLSSAVILFSSCGSGCRAPVVDRAYIEAFIEGGVRERRGAVPSGFDGISGADAYYLSLRARDTGMIGLSDALSEHAFTVDSGIWGREAVSFLAESCLEERRYKDAGFYAVRAYSLFPEYSFLRMITEADYWQHKDAEVLENLKALSAMPESAGDDELLLFDAVCRTRLTDREPDGSPQASDGLRAAWDRFFTEAEDSSLVVRGWTFLDGFNTGAGSPSLYELRHLAAEGRYSEAWTLLSSAAPGDMMFSSCSGVLPRVFEEICFKAGKSREGAVLLETVSAGNPESSTQLLFASGRLYRRAAQYGKAVEVLQKAYDSGPVEDGQRILWYLQDSDSRRNPSDVLKRLESYASAWEDPDYFSDTLEDLCTNLASRGRWDRISEMAGILEVYGPAEVFDRCRYITERAAESGLVRERAFSRAYTDPYYMILSGGFDFSGSPSTVSDGNTEGDPETEAYIRGFISHGMTDEAMKQLSVRASSVSEPFFAECAGILAERGRYLDSIRIMYMPDRNIPVYRMQPSGLRALYPAPYSGMIEKASRENGIPPELLYGIIWKESGFEADIVSRAGAVGLCQLMPSTARDVAGRLGIDMPDLEDPESNIMLGAWYFNWLKDYCGGISEAVLSYNGGPGRIKRLRKKYPGLPSDLFYELVPIPETHYYGKRVFTASVIYGSLYCGKGPEEVRAYFFPGI